MIVAHRPSMAGMPAFFRRYLLLLTLPIINVAGGAAHNVVISYLPAGSLAALSFAFIFATMAAGVLNVNIGLNTAINEERARDPDVLNKLWNESISLAIVCIVPMIVFSGFYGEELVSLLLQYGAFDETAAKIVGALLVLTLTLALHSRIQVALVTVLRARFMIVPILVSTSIAITTNLLVKILLVLGLGWGARGILVSQIVMVVVLIATQAIAASRHNIHMAVGAHARWAAWSAGCSALAILPLWLLTQTWTLPKLGILPVGAVYLAGFAVLVWQYRGAEKALLEQYAQTSGERRAYGFQALRPTPGISKKLSGLSGHVPQPVQVVLACEQRATPASGPPRRHRQGLGPGPPLVQADQLERRRHGRRRAQDPGQVARPGHVALQHQRARRPWPGTCAGGRGSRRPPRRSAHASAAAGSATAHSSTNSRSRARSAGMPGRPSTASKNSNAKPSASKCRAMRSRSAVCILQANDKKDGQVLAGVDPGRPIQSVAMASARLGIPAMPALLPRSVPTAKHPL